MRSVLALVAIALAVASPMAAAAYPRAGEQSPPHPPAKGKGDHYHHEHKRITKVPKKRQYVKVADLEIMNFALTLELMESSFFSQGVNRFKREDFETWPKMYEHLQSIASQESDHVKALKKALGDHAVSACEYDFGESLNSAEDFVYTSLILETVGASTYLGATPLLSTPELIEASGSILVNEARHGTFLSESLGLNGYSTSFETALNYKQAWTLAYNMIKIDKCAGVKNKLLPDDLNPFPALTIVKPEASKGFPFVVSKGSTLVLQFSGLPVSNDANDAAVPNDANDAAVPNDANDDSAAKAPKGKMAPKSKMAPKEYYAAFLNNGVTTYVPLEPVKSGANWQVQAPTNVRGSTYVMVTTSENSLSNNNTVAGPAIKFFY
ncbi:BQ5605_C001g00731 [Microbotryum silenes-dioicae]|uniref:BQ5605_C001g00731 protein n=1 Tax=Microbotryum silenes-dioicae TaxID=796604 RepID=A0A2X0P0P8_9BASI|nr:BQ5605_C001g00731 [Microbotryum silenes-dioicae]